MLPLHARAPITAIVYLNATKRDRILQGLADHLAATGFRLAGFIQTERVRPGRGRCDMLLEDLSSGEQIEISEDRGPLARGCRLTVAQLLYAAEKAKWALDRGCDMLVINKFGKTEAEGGGFRTLIGEALERSVPILIAVPSSNLESWRSFAGELATEFPVDELACDASAACRQMRLVESGNEIVQTRNECRRVALSSLKP